MTLTALLRTGEWTDPPPTHELRDGALRVTAERGSDFWRATLYGFTHDSGHALTLPADREGSFEVDFRLDYRGLYDQAGLLLRDDESTWLKAGVEVSDGVPNVGAVVTHMHSDWSLAPVPSWQGRVVTIRASWRAGAVTVRARPQGDRWRTVRVAPYDVGVGTRVGLYICAPQNEGLAVAFTAVRHGPPDVDLHADPD